MSNISQLVAMKFCAMSYERVKVKQWTCCKTLRSIQTINTQPSTTIYKTQCTTSILQYRSIMSPEDVWPWWPLRRAPFLL